jgi:hypothetical protein
MADNGITTSLEKLRKLQSLCKQVKSTANREATVINEHLLPRHTYKHLPVKNKT